MRRSSSELAALNPQRHGLTLADKLKLSEAAHCLKSLERVTRATYLRDLDHCKQRIILAIEEVLVIVFFLLLFLMHSAYEAHLSEYE